MPSSPASALEISLIGLAFHVRVGILPHERELPQPLEIDVIVRRSADAEGVLDYRAIHGAAEAVVVAGALEYLETIAMEIADRLLVLDGVVWCRVAVRKPNVMLAGPVAYAQVAIERANG